jgi:hypothetical protein
VPGLRGTATPADAPEVSPTARHCVADGHATLFNTTPGIFWTVWPVARAPVLEFSGADPSCPTPKHEACDGQAMPLKVPIPGICVTLAPAEGVKKHWETSMTPVRITTIGRVPNRCACSRERRLRSARFDTVRPRSIAKHGEDLKLLHNREISGRATKVLGGGTRDGRDREEDRHPPRSVSQICRVPR